MGLVMYLLSILVAQEMNSIRNQNISPNTLRCYEPSEKYKAIYHPQIPLRCITVQVDQEFIEQYLQEISGDLEVNFSDFFQRKREILFTKC